MVRYSYARNALMSGAVSVGALVILLVIYAWPLWTGEIIHLRVRPVDPRDIFRGDFVRLGYDFSRVRVNVDEGDLKVAIQPQTEPSADTLRADTVVEPSGEWWEEIRSQSSTEAVLQRWTRLRGKTFYLLLRRDESTPEYVPFAIAERPESGSQSTPAAVSLRVQVRFAQFPFLTLDNPIAAYFVQEGHGLAVEEALRQNKPVVVAVAVTRSGDARVRNLIVDGVPR